MLSLYIFVSYSIGESPKAALATLLPSGLLEPPQTGRHPIQTASESGLTRRSHVVSDFKESK